MGASYAHHHRHAMTGEMMANSMVSPPPLLHHPVLSFALLLLLASTATQAEGRDPKLGHLSTGNHPSSTPPTPSTSWIHGETTACTRATGPASPAATPGCTEEETQPPR